MPPTTVRRAGSPLSPAPASQQHDKGEERKAEALPSPASTSTATPADVFYFDALHRILLSHIRRGNAQAVMTVLAQPQVHQSPLFWRTCSYPTGLVAAVLSASAEATEKDPASVGRQGLLSLTIPDPQEKEAKEEGGKEEAVSSVMTLPELYMLLQWCLKQRESLRGAAELTEQGDRGLPDAPEPDYLFPPSTQTQEPWEMLDGALESSSDSERQDEEADDHSDDDAVHKDGDSFATVPARARRKRTRGGNPVDLAEARLAQRSSTAAAADLAVDMTLRRLIAQMEAPPSEEEVTTAQKKKEDAMVLGDEQDEEGDEEDKQADATLSASSDTIDVAALCQLLYSQCRYLEHVNPLASEALEAAAAAASETVEPAPPPPVRGSLSQERLVPAPSGPEPSVGDPFSPPPLPQAPPPASSPGHAVVTLTPAPEDIIVAPRQSVPGRAPPTSGTTPAPPTPLSPSMPHAAAALPLAQTSTSTPPASTDSIRLLQSIQPLPGSQRVVASFDDLAVTAPVRQGTGAEEEEGEEGEEVDETATVDSLVEENPGPQPHAQNQQSVREVEAPTEARHPVVDPVRVFDAFNAEVARNEMLARVPGAAGVHGRGAASGPKRRYRFTAEEDAAIIRGVARYGQSASAFSIIHRAFLGAWRPNRTPTHLYDHWRDALKARAMDQLQREMLLQQEQQQQAHAQGNPPVYERSGVAAAAGEGGMDPLAVAPVHAPPIRAPPPAPLPLATDPRNRRGRLGEGGKAPGSAADVAALRTLPRGIRPATAPPAPQQQQLSSDIEDTSQ